MFSFSKALFTYLKNCIVSIDDLQCIFHAFPRQLNALPLSPISSDPYHPKSLLKKKKFKTNVYWINEQGTKRKEGWMDGWTD